MSVLVAAGLFGIVAMMMAKTQSLGFKTQKKIENDTFRNQIREVISQRISCPQTLQGLQPGQCNGTDGASAVITLKDASGETIASGAGNATKYGDFAVRAICNKSAKEIVVRLGMSKSNVPLGTDDNSELFIKDPLTGQVMNWSHPKNLLFPTGTGLCKSHFGVAQSSTCDETTEGNTRYNQTAKQLEFCNGTEWKIPGKPDFVIAAQYHPVGQGQTACGTYTPASTNTGVHQYICVRKFNRLLSNTGGHGSINGSGHLVLEPGTYQCHLTGVGYQSETIRTRLDEISGTGLVFYGDQQLSEDTEYTSVSSSLITQFSIATRGVFRMSHWVRNQGLHDAGITMAEWPGYQAIMSCTRWN